MAKPKQIRKLSERVSFIRMMIVASPGFGKTVFAGTAPNALFLTTDPEGTVSAQRFGSDADEWPVKSWKDINDAYIYLRDEGSEEYEWLIIDNITEAQAMAMRDSMETDRKANPSRDEYIPAIQNYQRQQLATVAMVQKFNDLPMHVIYTAHKVDQEDAEGNPFYSAAIQGQQGQIAQQILGYMNIVGFGEVKQTESGKPVRRVYFDHIGSNRGKDRFQRLGRYRDNLDVPQLLEIVNSEPDVAPVRKPVKKTAATRRTTPTPKG